MTFWPAFRASFLPGGTVLPGQEFDHPFEVEGDGRQECLHAKPQPPHHTSFFVKLDQPPGETLPVDELLELTQEMVEGDNLTVEIFANERWGVRLIEPFGFHGVLLWLGFAIKPPSG